MRKRICSICNEEIHMINPKSWVYKKYKKKWHWACGYSCFSKLEDKLQVNKYLRR
jgi:hypothetical protein